MKKTSKNEGGLMNKMVTGQQLRQFCICIDVI